MRSIAVIKQCFIRRINLKAIELQKEEDKNLGCNLCRETKVIYSLRLKILGGMTQVIRICKTT